MINLIDGGGCCGGLSDDQWNKAGYFETLNHFPTFRENASRYVDFALPVGLDS